MACQITTSLLGYRRTGIPWTVGKKRSVRRNENQKIFHGSLLPLVFSAQRQSFRAVTTEQTLAESFKCLCAPSK